MGFILLNRDTALSKISEGGLGWAQLGYNDDVDNVEEDMIVQGGTYAWPAAATKMDLVSSDAADKGTVTAGTGARTVILCYLDAAGLEKHEEIILAGATPVTTAGTVWRVNDMRVATTGSNLKPVGNLTLSEVGGTTNVYGYIRAGYNRMRQCVYTVPTGKELYITSITVSGVNAAVSHWCRFCLMATYDEHDGTVMAAKTFVPFHEFFVVDQSFVRNLEIPTMFPAGVDLKMTALSDGATANEKCSCALRGYLVTV